MQDTKSLIESRSFWSAILMLVAVLASGFHLTDLGAWAADPKTIDAIMSGLAASGALGAIVFRYRATARVTTILPVDSGPGAGKAMAVLCALPIVAAAAACSPTQLNNYTNAANATAGVLKQIGVDAVRFDCQYGDLIRVVARDAGAARRVQATLDRNAGLVHDACPALTGTPAVNVVAGG
jgi:hypothetical protein